MHYSDLDLPVPYHETMDVLDSSKIQTFMDSPRRFFYQYILGWQGSAPNIHLVFGSAMHEAMEYLKIQRKHPAKKQYGYEADAVARAIDLFQECFDREYQHVILPGLAAGQTPAKNKANAAIALIQYAKEYAGDDFETLYTEVSGTVPVAEERVLHFKLDTIIKDERGIWSLEHKTTSRNTQAWRQKWSVIPQISTYLHALRSLFPDELAGVLVNGLILRAPTKTQDFNNEFMRIPVRKSNEMMVGWLGSINHQWDQIDWNMEQLAQHSASDEVLNCFYCNPISCTKFGCPYVDFCSVWPNPLQRADQPPAGFERSFWDPRRDHSRAKHVVHLEDSTTIKPVKADEASSDSHHTG